MHCVILPASEVGLSSGLHLAVQRAKGGEILAAKSSCIIFFFFFFDHVTSLLCFILFFHQSTCGHFMCCII